MVALLLRELAVIGGTPKGFVVFRFSSAVLSQLL
jgi:hypothetical protein